MSTKYLDENGVKILWDKTKEKIAESCAEVNAKVDEFQALPLEELNEIFGLKPITFQIHDEYKEVVIDVNAVEGMTWREFCSSEYNCHGFNNDEDLLIVAPGDEYIVAFSGYCEITAGGEPVRPDDVIMNDYLYTAKVSDEFKN